MIFDFPNGDRMPVFGLGTWNSKPGEVGAAVLEALSAGYRHIDCASIYGNEAEVGEALETAFGSGDLARGDVWVTSKLWSDSHEPQHVIPALERTLADLRLEYLDLYLIHWPVAFRKGIVRPKRSEDFFSPRDLPIETTWKVMEDAVSRGLCRHIGLSNFSPPLIEHLMATSDLGPEVLQVELHPYLQQTALVDFCQKNGIFVTAYSPLGSPARPESMRGRSEPILLEDPTVREIADRVGASPAQVLLSWALRRGTAVIPKSTHAQRIRENLASLELRLETNDIDRLTALERGFRYVGGSFWERAGSPYTAKEIFEGPSGS